MPGVHFTANPAPNPALHSSRPMTSQKSPKAWDKKMALVFFQTAAVFFQTAAAFPQSVLAFLQTTAIYVSAKHPYR
jgi:hypothetical protein